MIIHFSRTSGWEDKVIEIIKFENLDKIKARSIRQSHTLIRLNFKPWKLWKEEENKPIELGDQLSRGLMRK